MKVLVIGKGGREHALVRALRLSASVNEVHVVPGSDGMAKEALCHKEIKMNDYKAIMDLICWAEIQLVVVGPEVPLAEGLSDHLRKHGVLVFGPSQKAAQLEASKIFSKRFFNEAGIPTARSFEVETVATTMEKAKGFLPPYVLKADGLAAGKGVFICKDTEELKDAAEFLFEKKGLGEAGHVALLEEFTEGYELSCLILTNGKEWELLPQAQDNKRLLDGDCGPNTGGMGVVAPVQISDGLKQTIEEKVLAPTMKQLEKEDLLYRGVLFMGLMITADGPSLLEFNVRFGDPEAQALLPLLEGDWGEVMKSVAEGRIPNLKWKPLSSACIVLAAKGYPDAPEKGIPIEGAIDSDTHSSYFLHAGVKLEENSQWVTDGGRVLNAIGIGNDLNEALSNAYSLAEKVRWPGHQMRSDIGKKVLLAKEP